MSAQYSGYRILIVEDNPGDVALIEDFLFEQIKSLRTTISNSFKGAKDILSQADDSFDVILLDLTLPDKSGVDLIEELIKICNDTPIIVLTGYADLEFGIKTLSLGVSDYILKDELDSINLYKSILYGFERQKNSRMLKESEKKYNDLFHLSPLPMWVFDAETLQFLDVNNAAINHYGYTKSEFLSMTIKDIRPLDEMILLEQALDDNYEKAVHNGVFRHIKKSGELINVDIQASSILFNTKSAKIIVATDITDRINYIKTIENQNEKFKEIAWIQSHIVRAPLARMMGFIPLIKNKVTDKYQLEKMLDYILVSANELDIIIRDITQKAHDISNMPGAE